MIRPLRESDLPACLALSAEAGWNQTASDWLAALALAPDSAWGFEDAGEIVGTTTAVAYGRRLAWIGMVLVRGDRRRRGIARRLMERALAWCDATPIECVKLDATDLGRPLYAALGFEDEQPIERWGGEGGSGVTRPSSIDFSGDALLTRLAAVPGAEAFGDPQAYLLTRPGANARYLGPLVAPAAQTARALLEEALAGRPGEPFFWDVLSERSEITRLAEGLGFRPLRRLVRMVRPADARVDDNPNRWAAAGFEYG